MPYSNFYHAIWQKFRPTVPQGKTKAQILKEEQRELVERYSKPILTRFELDAAPQGRSCFIRCPAEIRIKILSFLLCQGLIFSSMELSSQILRTCQILYHEGVAVLYGTNVLSLKIRGPFEYMDDMRFTVMGTEIHMSTAIMDLVDSYFPGPSDLDDEDLFFSDVLPIVMEVLKRFHENLRGVPTDLPQSCIQVESDVNFLKQYLTITRFQKLEIDFQHIKDEYGDRHTSIFFSCARALKDLLVDKHVSIDLSFHSDSLMSEHDTRNLLRNLKSLRCKSISISMPQPILVTFSQISIFRDTVVKTVESYQPVFDSWRKYLEVIDRVYRLIPSRNSWPSDDWPDLECHCVRKLRNLRQTAMLYDPERFRESVTTTLDSIIHPTSESHLHWPPSNVLSEPLRAAFRKNVLEQKEKVLSEIPAR